MNQVTPEQKDSVTKTLAIVGFVAAILFAVWLAVQIVSVIPSAFSSLASIADGVYNYDENKTFTVTTKNSVVNNGEVFTLSWTNMSRPGIYSFSYNCTKGASASVQDVQGAITALNCDTSLSLDKETTLDVIINSEKQRFTDVTYTLTYTPADKTIEPIQTNGQMTIVNASIPTQTLVTKEVVPLEGDTEVTPNTNKTNANTVAPTTEPVTSAQKTVKKFIYAIPTSDPNGKIDLQITYLGVGTLTGETFIHEAAIPKDKQGSFQFAVQNVGTKTSDSWDYQAHLPEGIEYSSGPQVALKPNEKSIVTIGFNGLTRTGTEKFGVDVSAAHDTNKNNNSFTWAVKIVK